MSIEFRPDGYRAMTIDGYEVTDGRFVGTYTLRGVDPADDVTFSEAVDFGAALAGQPDDRLLRLLTVTCSLSYYKAAAPPRIEIAFPTFDFERDYLRALIAGGLGEFAYCNSLPDALTPDVSGPEARQPADAVDDDWDGGRAPLVPVGGGKDSVVTIEALKRHGFHPMLFSVNKFAPIDRCIDVSGLDSIRVTRTIDRRLIEVNAAGAHNGHVPVTAINSVIGLIVADAKGLGPVVFSNEKSSNVGNISWMGRDVNHQWSKSIEYESLLRNVLSCFGMNPDRYFSLLRGLSESEIADRFRGCPQYFREFISCNRPFALDPERRAASWCGHCPKCLFVFALMAPRLGRTEVEAIFGRNLFVDNGNRAGFEDIVGLGVHKPFECVGEYYEAAESLLAVLDDDEWAGLPMVEAFRSRRSEVEAVAAKHDDGSEVEYVPERYKAALGLSWMTGMDESRTDLTGLDVGIWGLGREGISMARTASAAGAAHVVAVDDGAKGALDVPEGMAEVTVLRGRRHLNRFDECDVVFVSPGVPWRHPVFERLRNSGQRISNAADWYMARNGARTIGVTGTKGKSTTASFLGHLLLRLGVRAVVAGNIGTPLSDLAPDDDAVVVAELSSQQCALLTTSPAMAVITNLHEDHLDWHGDVDAYHLAKANVFRNGARSLVCTRGVITGLERIGVASFPPSLHVLEPAELPRGKGRSVMTYEHNVVNGALAAVAAGEWLGRAVTPEEADAAVESFEALPHRLQTVRTTGSSARPTRWIDDTLATTGESVVAALLAMRPDDNVALIVGGMDRQLDYQQLDTYLCSGSRRVELIQAPSNGTVIGRAYATEHPTKTHVVASLEDAVRMAATLPDIDVVLLSPGAASYDLFADYKAKAAAYCGFIDGLAGPVGTPN